MALTACKECSAQVSTKAKACPRCGAERSTGWGVLRVLGAIVGGFVLIVVALIAWSIGSAINAVSTAHEKTASTQSSKTAVCSVSDITIKSLKARFVNPCTTRSCYTMKGVAVLTNNCKEPVGIEVKITGYNKAGEPVATRDLWPASVSNIPPGDYEFSLDTWLDYDPAIRRFALIPIRVRQWRR